jgi:hypothetical protein
MLGPDLTWAPPVSYTHGNQVFPWGKAAGAWSRLPTPSSAEVRVDLYLYSTPRAVVACSRVNFNCFTFYNVYWMTPNKTLCVYLRQIATRFDLTATISS